MEYILLWCFWVNIILNLFTGQGVLLDRSVFSDAVFAEVNYQQGTISPEGTNTQVIDSY